MEVKNISLSKEDNQLKGVIMSDTKDGKITVRSLYDEEIIYIIYHNKNVIKKLREGYTLRIVNNNNITTCSLGLYNNNTFSEIATSRGTDNMVIDELNKKL